MRKLTNRVVKSITDPRYDVLCIEAWTLRSKGFRLEDICKKMDVTQTTVSCYLRRAAELVREERVESAKTDFEQAVALNDYLLRTLMGRIEESKSPTLNLNAIDHDLNAGKIKPFVLEPYWSPETGTINAAALRQDYEAGKLGPLVKYVIPGRLDMDAVKQLRAASESRRKLLGIDKDKQRIELTGEDGGAVKVDLVSEEIVKLAERRKQARVIEVEAREAT